VSDRAWATAPASGNRPGIGNRPGGGERPGIGNRPGIGTRPDRPNTNVNRPNLNLGNRVIQNNVNNITINRWNQFNQRANFNRPWYARWPGYRNRPWFASRPAWVWGRPWYRFHYRWHFGFWNWRTLPAFWLGDGGAAGLVVSPGDTFVFNNPYFVAPAQTTVVVQPVFNYSAPIPAPTVTQATLAFPPPPDQQVLDSGEALPTTGPPPPENEDETVAQANKQFDAARAAFTQHDFARAQTLAEKAINLLPSDATLHEFRALTLFAQGRYKDAAATLYAVLAAGPGWDWQTMSGLYADEETYTRHLRALEQYVREHPNSAAPRFVLAYQYLVLGAKDEAIDQFKAVLRLEPKDNLSAALLEALTTPDPAIASATAPGGN
jgi:tetratricopeptide (TPR) repeat protein